MGRPIRIGNHAKTRAQLIAKIGFLLALARDRVSACYCAFWGGFFCCFAFFTPTSGFWVAKSDCGDRTSGTLHGRDRIIDADGHEQALQHFHVARHAAVLGLPDAARFFRRVVLRPALYKLLVGALLIVHAALVVLRNRQIHRLIDGRGRLAAGRDVKFRGRIGDHQHRPATAPTRDMGSVIFIRASARWSLRPPALVSHIVVSFKPASAVAG